MAGICTSCGRPTAGDCPCSPDDGFEGWVCSCGDRNDWWKTHCACGSREDERFGFGVCRTGRCDEPCGPNGGCIR